MHIPRKETLSEVIYRDIEKNWYLNEIYNSLIYNYSNRLFKMGKEEIDVNIDHALRFADILSKSTYEPNAEMHRIWGQEIVILLNELYPNNLNVQYYLGSILSYLGNYRGLNSSSAKEFESADLLERIFYEYDKENHLIPGKVDEYFFHDQKNIYDNLETEFFSYSGPTSMGKSFVVQTYIEEQIRQGSTKNYAILVPTRALINEVRSNIISALKEELNNKNYRVITASEELALKQNHHFIFVMTPERMSYMLISTRNVKIDFLFIDEAHKISDTSSRNVYYFKVITQVLNTGSHPKIIFASPNIPNPEIYLKIIPNQKYTGVHKLSSKYSPVCQFKYYIDLVDKNTFAYNDFTKKFNQIDYSFKSSNLTSIVNQIGSHSQNLVYCSSKNAVLKYSMKYAEKLPVLNNSKLITLSNDIRQEIHQKCFLADLVLKGVAYHVGYLPASIRLRIERSFENGDIKTIFCTSTLVEGVNLPADNLFITNYKNGNSNMNEVEFKNLIGRVGRIKFNLYGNVFLIREDPKQKIDKYIELLKSEVPNQTISLDNEKIKKSLKLMISDLERGDIELTNSRNSVNDKDYDTLRKFSLVLTRDVAVNEDTPVVIKFEEQGLITDRNKTIIKSQFSSSKTSDDITVSYDQMENLREAIADGLEYPKFNNGRYDFEEVVEFMVKLKKIFRWDIYEKKTVGKKGIKSDNSPLYWYSLLLLRWIEGNGLNRIIFHSLDYKAKHPESGVQINNGSIIPYDKNSSLHQNFVIADTLNDIENVLLFTISNYFRKFSIEYKTFYGLEYFPNDWYEYVEYGTTNPTTIFLQQSGFSRETSTYIQNNASKYIMENDGVIKLKRTLLTCGKLGVETEANDIQFNAPELFID